MDRNGNPSQGEIDDKEIQQLIDATTPKNMPSTAWGLRDMLRSRGFVIVRQPPKTAQEAAQNAIGQGQGSYRGVF